MTKTERANQKRELSLKEMVTKKQVKNGELAKSVLEVLFTFSLISWYLISFILLSKKCIRHSVTLAEDLNKNDLTENQ